jgi:hypothetical protein
MWPVDKLQIIQDACTQTGNNPPNVAEDGSEEWTHGSVAYELALPYAIEARNWKFGTAVTVLTPTGVAPTDPLFDTAYAKPPDLLHLIWVRLDDLPVVYQILNNQIVLNNTGALAVTAKYVRAPTLDQATPTFAMALRAFTAAGIYRGLNEDTSAADRSWALGEQLIQNAATRADQEEPKRAVFSSRLAMSRRARRPWVRWPPGWGGSGVPN